MKGVTAQSTNTVKRYSPVQLVSFTLGDNVEHHKFHHHIYSEGASKLMDRIVVSDIFGRTDALEEICSRFSGNTEIVDSYDSTFIEFKNENEAYFYFMSNVGLDKYCDMLREKIFQTPHTIKLIGFSVGASAIWQLSEKFSPSKVLGAVCFYGSQIRKIANINPSFQIRIILPVKEEKFSVADLLKILSQKKNVKIYKSDYLHGFMNKYSNNYNLSGYSRYLEWLSAETVIVATVY